MNSNKTTLSIFPEIPLAFYDQLVGLSGVNLYHTKAWHDFLQKAFSWKVSALADVNEVGELGFFLPYITKHRFSSKVRIALPFSHLLGPATAAGTDLRSYSLPDVGSGFEVHTHLEVDSPQYLGEYYLSKLDLTHFPSLDALFSTFSESSIQRKVKKAQKSPITVLAGCGRDEIEAFSHLQSLTRWRQGSPSYPPSFFNVMAEELSGSGHMQLYLAVLNHKPVSGVIFLYYGDQAVYGYGASTNDRSIWPLGVNQLVMWEAIKDAYQRGYRWVDFGRTPQSHTSLLAYKEKWGAVSSPLEYSYYGSRTSPSQRENTVVKIASRFLQLMPYPLFKHISPTILKNAI